MGYALERPWIDAKQMGQRDFFRFARATAWKSRST